MATRNPGTQSRLGTRRGVIAGAAAGIGSLLVPKGIISSATAAQQEDGALVAPPWDAVPACTPSPTDRAGQGPFFIHDGEREDDASLYRQDIRGRYNANAEPGTELQLHLRVLSGAGAQCGGAPLPDVEIYVWHCDAQGFYSGFGEPGEQTPDEVYRFRPNHNDLDNNTRFCRGACITDGNGVVSFRTIFPGWYNGRDIHIHVMVLKRGSVALGRNRYRGGDHLYTTQLYFEPQLIDRVHKAAEPYRRRTALPAYAGLILGDERGASGLRMKAEFDSRIAVAQMQLVIDPSQSRA